MLFEVRQIFSSFTLRPITTYILHPLLTSLSSSFYCIGLADSLRSEMILHDISVHLFLPATIFSPGFDRENVTKPALTKAIEGPDEGMTCEAVAGKLIAGELKNFVNYAPFLSHKFLDYNVILQDSNETNTT